MKLTFGFFKRIVQFRMFPKPSHAISGYTTRCEDGSHVLFLDYDMVAPEIVQQDLKNIGQAISHALVFTTDEVEDELGKYGNYHVICLDKFTFHECLDIMSMTHCDNLHRDLAKRSRYRSWVLRFTGKGKRPAPRFVEMSVFGDMRETQQSRAHKKLIEVLHPELKPLLAKLIWNVDKSKKAIVTHYNTVYEKKK